MEGEGRGKGRGDLRIYERLTRGVDWPFKNSRWELSVGSYFERRQRLLNNLADRPSLILLLNVFQMSRKTYSNFRRAFTFLNSPPVADAFPSSSDYIEG